MATNSLILPSPVRSSAMSICNYPIGYRLNVFFGLSLSPSGRRLIPWRCRQRCSHGRIYGDTRQIACLHSPRLMGDPQDPGQQLVGCATNPLAPMAHTGAFMEQVIPQGSLTARHPGITPLPVNLIGQTHQLMAHIDVSAPDVSGKNRPAQSVVAVSGACHPPCPIAGNHNTDRLKTQKSKARFAGKLNSKAVSPAETRILYNSIC